MRIAYCEENLQDQQFYMGLFRQIILEKQLDAALTLYESGKALLFDMEEASLRPDIIFMGIHMRKTRGMDVAKSLRKHAYGCKIVFLTESEDPRDLLDALDVRASNYLVKNQTSEEKLQDVLLSLYREVEGEQQESAHFTCAGVTCSVPIKDIYYFEVENRIITVFYKNGTFKFYSTLDKIEKLLQNKGFIRCHRSTLVAVRYISQVKDMHLILFNGSILPIARQCIPEVRTAFLGTEEKDQAAT